MLYNLKKKQLHAVSRTQQGRQREPSVKTLRSQLSAEFCVLSGRTQRPRFISSSGGRTHNQTILQSHLVPLRHDSIIY